MSRWHDFWGPFVALGATDGPQDTSGAETRGDPDGPTRWAPLADVAPVLGVGDVFGPPPSYACRETPAHATTSLPPVDIGNGDADARTMSR
jgi:hypothetical protein